MSKFSTRTAALGVMSALALGTLASVPAYASGGGTEGHKPRDVHQALDVEAGGEARRRPHRDPVRGRLEPRRPAVERRDQGQRRDRVLRVAHDAGAERFVRSPAAHPEPRRYRRDRRVREEPGNRRELRCPSVDLTHRRLRPVISRPIPSTAMTRRNAAVDNSMTTRARGADRRVVAIQVGQFALVGVIAARDRRPRHGHSQPAHRRTGSDHRRAFLGSYPGPESRRARSHRRFAHGLEGGDRATGSRSSDATCSTARSFA